MPYRSIDLQVSIPRTPEASALQHQALQKSVLDQGQLAADNIKEAEQQRRQNQAVEQGSALNIRDQGHRGGDSSQNEQRRKQEGQSEEDTNHVRQNSQHPFKGKHIDISL